jgi:hypothetical protein
MQTKILNELKIDFICDQQIKVKIRFGFEIKK